MYLGHMLHSILDIDGNNDDNRNQKANKEDWLHPEEGTVFNNFDGPIVESVFVLLTIYLIDDGANKIKRTRLHAQENAFMELKTHRLRRTIYMINKHTCRNLLTEKTYGNVAWAEVGTDALLKLYT